MDNLPPDKNIDIIIPTYGRGSILAERLPSYWVQKKASKIIIVDSGSDISTEEVINKIKNNSPIPIFYHRFPVRQVQQVCKNYGVSISDAPYIFIGEDDLELPAEHLTVLLETLSRTGSDIVGGRRLYIRDGESQTEALKNAPKKGKLFYHLPFEAYFEAYFEGEIEVPYLHSNVLAKRTVFEQVKYDDRYQGNAFREELDFYLNCSSCNFKMLVTSKTACFHLKSSRKKGTGSQIARLRYEYYVWLNTLKCFWKNRQVLRKKFNIQFPILHALLSLFARYSNGLKRRLIGS